MHGPRVVCPWCPCGFLGGVPDFVRNEFLDPVRGRSGDADDAVARAVGDADHFAFFFAPRDEHDAR